MKKIVTYIIVVLVIVVALIAGKKAVNKKLAEDKALPTAITYSINVKTIKPKLNHNILTLPYLAVTKSNDDVKISSKANGRIKYIVKSSKNVKKGEIIVKIDDKDLKTKFEAISLNIKSLKSQLKSKQIALKNLISTHKRTKKLLDVKGASQESYDKEETNIEAMTSALDSLKFKIKELQANQDSIDNMLSYTTIKAPVAGIVTRLSNIGDIAMMGKPIVTISASTNSYLVVRLPDNLKANKIIFKNKKYNLLPLNTTYNGLLEYLANIDESLVSNQTVDIDVVVYDDNGYMIPHDAILNQNGKNIILTIKNDKAITKEITILANGEQGVIVNNLKNYNNIVVAKQDILLKLLTGISVKTTKD